MRGHGTAMVGEAMPIAAATALGTFLSCFFPPAFPSGFAQGQEGL